ncbi:MAG: hypothetical protein ABEJ86_00630 [Halococcoides sp.]
MGRPNYYDLVLAVIPLTMVGLTGSLVVAGVSSEIALAAGSLLAAGCIGHAVFVRAPVTNHDEAVTPRNSVSRST